MGVWQTVCRIPAGTLILSGALAGCGRLGFDALVADGPVDVGGDGPGAFATGVFSVPVPITDLNSGLQDDEPTLTGDLLEIYFETERLGVGTNKIFTSTRPSTMDAWAIPTQVPLACGGCAAPLISRDGLTLVYAADRVVPSGNETYQVTRAARGQPWAGASTVRHGRLQDRDDV